MSLVLAGSSTLELTPAPNLFAGSAPITTNRAQVSVALDQYEVIAIVGDEIVAWNPDGVDGSEVAAGILATATEVGSGWAPYYTGGDFNHEALVWPAAIDTLAERRAAFSHTGTIKISALV